MGRPETFADMESPLVSFVHPTGFFWPIAARCEGLLSAKSGRLGRLMNVPFFVPFSSQSSRKNDRAVIGKR